MGISNECECSVANACRSLLRGYEFIFAAYGMPDTSLPFPTVCIITRTRPSVSRMKLISTSFQFMVSDGILCRLLMVTNSPRPHQTKQEKHPDEHGPALTSDLGIERLPISSYTSYLLLCYCATACCCVLCAVCYLHPTHSTPPPFFPLPFYVNPLTHYPIPTTHYPLPATHSLPPCYCSVDQSEYTAPS